MLSYEQGLAILKTQAESRAKLRVEIQTSLLLSSVGKNLAFDIYSLSDNPRFDNSAMDGFLVNSKDTNLASEKNPIKLRVLGSILAGQETVAVKDSANSCYSITTGSMIPSASFDAVVRVEDLKEISDTSVTTTRPIQKGENVRFSAEDYKKGELLISKGTKIRPEHLLVLSNNGYKALKTLKPLRVALFSTGDELVNFESLAEFGLDNLKASQIINSTSPLLISSLRDYQVEVNYFGIVADNPKEIKNTISYLLESKPDIVISTGGVSVGKSDFIKEVLLSLKSEIHFHKLKIRPGKPIVFSSLSKECVFFGLPGNPIAVNAAIYFFIKPYIKFLFGEIPKPFLTVPITESLNKQSDLTFFYRGVIEADGVKPLKAQASFMLKSMVQADGWIIAPEGRSEIEVGNLVKWQPL